MNQFKFFVLCVVSSLWLAPSAQSVTVMYDTQNSDFITYVCTSPQNPASKANTSSSCIEYAGNNSFCLYKSGTIYLYATTLDVFNWKYKLIKTVDLDGTGVPCIHIAVQGEWSEGGWPSNVTVEYESINMSNPKYCGEYHPCPVKK